MTEDKRLINETFIPKTDLQKSFIPKTPVDAPRNPIGGSVIPEAPTSHDKPVTPAPSPKGD